MTIQNSADLRVRDLRVLSLILQERNLTRAAERLDTTQPAISKVLAKLRAHFGDPLFVRGSDGMRPTARAQEIAPRLRQGLTQLQEATNFLQGHEGGKLFIEAVAFRKCQVSIEPVERRPHAGVHQRLRLDDGDASDFAGAAI